jgi:hypothetical protein
MILRNIYIPFPPWNDYSRILHEPHRGWFAEKRSDLSTHFGCSHFCDIDAACESFVAPSSDQAAPKGYPVPEVQNGFQNA